MVFSVGPDSVYGLNNGMVDFVQVPLGERHKITIPGR